MSMVLLLICRRGPAKTSRCKTSKLNTGVTQCSPLAGGPGIKVISCPMRDILPVRISRPMQDILPVGIHRPMQDVLSAAMSATFHPRTGIRGTNIQGPMDKAILLTGPQTCPLRTIVAMPEALARFKQLRVVRTHGTMSIIKLLHQVLGWIEIEALYCNFNGVWVRVTFAIQ